MKEKISQFVKTNRNYRPYSLHLNIVEKTFNNGSGSLGLFRFYPERKKVAVNKLLCTKNDERKLDEFLRDCHCEDFERVYVSLGYPDYYFKHLSC